MDKNQVADDLEAVADLFESGKVEWCRGTLYQRTTDSLLPTHVCAVGALRYAIGGVAFISRDTDVTLYLERLVPASSALVKALEKRIDGSLMANVIAGWNDRIAADKQEVIDVFKETAKDLRNASAPCDS